MQLRLQMSFSAVLVTFNPKTFARDRHATLTYVMRIYFDMCSLQRPLDDQTQFRVRVESQAVLGMLIMCEVGRIDLIASEALVFEIDANPDAVRRDFAAQVIAKATHFVETDDQIKAQAQKFIAAGIKSLDALHLASAIAAQAEFFCTCDDRLCEKSSFSEHGTN